MTTITKTRASKRASTRSDVLRALRVQEAALRDLRVASLFLYGSAGRDDMSDTSDVDLFFDYAPRRVPTLLTLVQLSAHLTKALGRPVDVTTRDGLHPLLRTEILRQAVRVF